MPLTKVHSVKTIDRVAEPKEPHEPQSVARLMLNLVAGKVVERAEH